MPPFSLVIPTLNSDQTLSRCLESVVAQTFRDFEVLIIDGISNDNTLPVAHSFNDPRIRIVSEADNGIYEAMNKGIDLAKGDWVYFLGSDDVLNSSTVLQKVAEFCSKEDLDVVYGSVNVVGDTDWAKDGEIYDGAFTLKKLLSRNICHQAIFYNSSVFDAVGKFKSKYRVCADWDLNLHAWSQFKFTYMDIIIADFYGGSVSSGQKDHLYGEERWSNIAQYFRWKLLLPQFWRYSRPLLKCLI